MVIEGEIDPYIETSNICIGFHQQEEEIFKCAAIEIKCDGNALVEDLPLLQVENHVGTDIIDGK